MDPTLKGYLVLGGIAAGVGFVGGALGVPGSVAGMVGPAVSGPLYLFTVVVAAQYVNSWIGGDL